MTGRRVEWRVHVICCVLMLKLVSAHNDAAAASPCDSGARVTLKALFMPGVITVDADSDDWTNVEGSKFKLLPAIDSDPAEVYAQGSGEMEIKVVHDGRDLFFLLQVPGAYIYHTGDSTRCPSVALMFAVGDHAAYYNMGGCHAGMDTCSTSTCSGHEVDIVHFSIGTAIPGRLYGANLFDNLNGTGIDSFGSLNDMYAWNPHCRYLDGMDLNGTQGGAQNDWRGAWTHSSITDSYGLVQSNSPYVNTTSDGLFTFEFARPLRTGDRFQQDVQFTVGGIHRFASAWWYPADHQPWKGSEHYSVNCAWLPLEILSARSSTGQTITKVVDAVSILAVFLALGALGTAAAVGWWVKTNNRVSFTSISTL